MKISENVVTIARRMALFVLVCCLALASFAEEKGPPEEMFPSLDLLGSSVAIVESDYVDKINATNLIYGALHGMLRSLDPHSEFMEPDATAELKADTEGEFGGIGIEIGVRDDFPTVIAPMEDTPAFEAGLMPNDKIIKIGSEATRDMSLGAVIKRLRGEPGTEVTITIQRSYKDKREVKEVTIERAIIKTQKVRNVEMLDTTNAIGYVRMIGFDKTTRASLEDAIESLTTQGMESLVLDMRNNGGGLLSVAVEVADMFLQSNQVIVSTRGRAAGQSREYRAASEGAHYTMPLVVLVNGASASASEIVCGAIKDHHRGVIIGSKTFGKGSVQTVVPVGRDNCSIRLTTAKYYTPSGVCIHGTGIFPNIEAKISLEDEIKLIQKRSRAYKTVDHDTLSDEECKQYDELKSFRDAQLDRAVDLLTALRFLRQPSEVRGEK